MIIVIFACLLLCSGCGLMTHGTKQQVLLETNPAGAVVTDGENFWQTPAKIKLPRKKDHVLTVFLPGYTPEYVGIQRKLNNSVVAVVLPGGSISLGIDAMTGAQWHLVPDKVNVNLKLHYAAESYKTPLQLQLHRLLVER